MKSQRLFTALALINLGSMLFPVMSRTKTVEASGPLPLLRGSGLEIVDTQGKVRAMIKVLPAGPAQRADGTVVNNGKVIPDTVLFRLIRPDGRPSVKIATSEDGSGLTPSGGIDPTYIVLDSNGGDPEIALTNKDGKRQTIKPWPSLSPPFNERQQPLTRLHQSETYVSLSYLCGLCAARYWRRIYGPR